MADKILFGGSIPDNYDKYMGPLLFESYAVDIAECIKGKKYTDVLELACGTGRVTNQLAKVLPESVNLTVTDLNPDMVETAKTKIMSNKKIMWKTADMQSLPFENSSFDLVVCQFGIMFVPDKERAYSEIYRVLRPGGKFLFNTWDSMINNMPIQYTTDILDSYFKDNPVTFFHIPYSYYNKDEISTQLSKAGFEKISFTTVQKECQSDSAKDAAKGLIQGNPTITAINARNPDLVNAIEDELSKKLSEKFGAKPMKCNLQAIIIEGIKIGGQFL
ncbi:MAG: methyltransferase domain-containing protein [Ignavibacteria bacterium]